jgi:hypothetical protein
MKTESIQFRLITLLYGTQIFFWKNVSAPVLYYIPKRLITIIVGAKIVLCREIFKNVNILPFASQFFHYCPVLRTTWKAFGTNSG